MEVNNINVAYICYFWLNKVVYVKYDKYKCGIYTSDWDYEYYIYSKNKECFYIMSFILLNITELKQIIK